VGRNLCSCKLFFVSTKDDDGDLKLVCVLAKTTLDKLSLLGRGLPTLSLFLCQYQRVFSAGGGALSISSHEINLDFAKIRPLYVHTFGRSFVSSFVHSFIHLQNVCIERTK